ncbi:MAG TPA: DUF4936 family protein [Caldimonas sp.]|jgi:hypothetical protein|nr:DUF4936 family protein [Caldimonas sp.]
MAGRELFVWYRVRRERAEAARAVVASFQRALATRWPGLQARLLVRDDGATATWMEAYARSARSEADGRDDGNGDGIDPEIEAAIAAAAEPLAALIEGPRHVEAFAVTG